MDITVSATVLVFNPSTTVFQKLLHSGMQWSLYLQSWGPAGRSCGWWTSPLEPDYGESWGCWHRPGAAPPKSRSQSTDLYIIQHYSSSYRSKSWSNCVRTAGEAGKNFKQDSVIQIFRSANQYISKVNCHTVFEQLISYSIVLWGGKCNLNRTFLGKKKDQRSIFCIQVVVFSHCPVSIGLHLSV